MVTFVAAAFSYTYYQELLVFLLTAIKKFTFPLGISQKVDSEAVSLVGAGGGGGISLVFAAIFSELLPNYSLF